MWCFLSLIFENLYESDLRRANKPMKCMHFCGNYSDEVRLSGMKCHVDVKLLIVTLATKLFFAVEERKTLPKWSDRFFFSFRIHITYGPGSTTRSRSSKWSKKKKKTEIWWIFLWKAEEGMCKISSMTQHFLEEERTWNFLPVDLMPVRCNMNNFSDVRILYRKQHTGDGGGSHVVVY